MMTLIRRCSLAGVLAASSLASRASAQAAQNPDSARLLTGSISKFWLSIDRWAGRDSAALVAALRDNYFANPSPGLFDWMVNRLISQNAVGQVMQAHGVDRQRAMRGMTAAPGTPDRALFDTLVMPSGRGTLLSSALNEGSADFLAELISGEHIINPAYAFGDPDQERERTRSPTA